MGKPHFPANLIPASSIHWHIRAPVFISCTVTCTTPKGSSFLRTHDPVGVRNAAVARPSGRCLPWPAWKNGQAHARPGKPAGAEGTALPVPFLCQLRISGGPAACWALFRVLGHGCGHDQPTVYPQGALRQGLNGT